MHWLFLLLALGAMAFAIYTTSTALMVVALLVGLGLMVAWVVGLYNARIGGNQRDQALMIDPEELRRMRELGEARRAEAAAAEAAAAAAAPRPVPQAPVTGRAVFPLPDDLPPR